MGEAGFLQFCESLEICVMMTAAFIVTGVSEGDAHTFFEYQIPPIKSACMPGSSSLGERQSGKRLPTIWLGVINIDQQKHNTENKRQG